VTATLILALRHGRTGHNQLGVWQGQLDVELDDVGRAQARRAALALTAQLKGVEPLRVVTSDLSRASQTAAEVGRSLGVAVESDARLREVDAGHWQGLTREEIVARGMGADFEAWSRGEDVALGGAERRSDAARRAADAAREHAEAMNGGTLVLVGHGGSLRGAALVMVGLPPFRWDLLGGLRNCHWYELHAGRDGWRLLTYNVGATDADRVVPA
jgi:probable phosphoglycerate mutase